MGPEGFFDQMGLVHNGLGEDPASGIAAGTREKAYTTDGLLAKSLQGKSTMKAIPLALCIAAMFFLATVFQAAGCRGDTVENGSYGDAGAASDSGGTPLDGASTAQDGGSDDHGAGGDGAADVSAGTDFDVGDVGSADAGASDASLDAGQKDAGGHVIEGSPFGFHPGNAAGYSYLRDLGAVWSREGTYTIWTWVDPNRNGGLSFKKAVAPPKEGMPGPGVAIDYDAIRAAPPEDVHIMTNVCPFRNGESEFATEAEKGAYAAFVTKMVERYDGDTDLGCVEAPPDCYRLGNAEFPTAETIARLSANPVKHWQMCNQVLDTCHDDCRATHAAKFAEAQRLTYGAVKAADPEAQVLMAGDSAKEEYPAVFSALGGAGLDIVDFHRFGTEDGYDPGDHLAFLKAALSGAGFGPETIRFWITETGTYSGDPQDERAERDLPFQGERQQARGLIKLFVAALGVGVEKVFWAWNIVEGFGCDCCIFDYTGLVYDGNDPANASGCDAKDPYDLGKGIKKLAYYSFQFMFDKLDGATTVREETQEDGLRLFRFEMGGRAVWVAWNDAGDDRTLIISGVGTERVRATETIPGVELGRDVVDPAGAFAQSEENVSGGEVRLRPLDVPLIIEEIPE
ncbi:MAG: hypothetical protein HY897_20160 [Deltaproteobacteria bacterium]|nr:hypothetical protein [Deltaproteobacteria bacterium]